MTDTKALARGLFFRVYKGDRNIVTPNIDSYGITGKYAWEIAHGESVFRKGSTSYAVTVISIESMERLPELNKYPLETYGDALTYVENTLAAL